VQLARERSKITYELVSLVSGILGGALAGAIFNRIWRAVSHEDEAPQPTALDRNIREVLVAGAVQGAIFGLVKAAFGRITARGYRQFTGTTPNS
jgi:membrane associated rhomboid family serine protease